MFNDVDSSFRRHRRKTEDHRASLGSLQRRPATSGDATRRNFAGSETVRRKSVAVLFSPAGVATRRPSADVGEDERRRR